MNLIKFLFSGASSSQEEKNKTAADSTPEAVPQSPRFGYLKDYIPLTHDRKFTRRPMSPTMRRIYEEIQIYDPSKFCEMGYVLHRKACIEVVESLACKNFISISEMMRYWSRLSLPSACNDVYYKFEELHCVDYPDLHPLTIVKLPAMYSYILTRGMSTHPERMIITVDSEKIIDVD